MTAGHFASVESCIKNKEKFCRSAENSARPALANAVKPVIIQASTYRRNGFFCGSAAAAEGPCEIFEGKTNGTCDRTTIDTAAEPRLAGPACRCTPDHPGAGGLFCAWHGLRHLRAVAGAAGVDAHAHGHGGVWRLAGICAGKPAAQRVFTALRLFDGPDDSGPAPVLRPCHAGALQGLRPAQLLHDLCHE